MHQTLGYLDRVTSSVKSGGMAALSLSLSPFCIYVYIMYIFVYIYNYNYVLVIPLSSVIHTYVISPRPTYVPHLTAV